ncbi:MAG: hypothetical protein KDC44_15810, partial [Phaeodactylibacter sp.]|nr:hypothetical protein [Phaeodactylibacter sp.]
MEDYSDERSEEVQEILGTPPSWLVQWGTTVIIGSLIALGALSWAFKFPEKIEGRVTITTMQPPIPVVAPSEGYISEYWVEEGDSVEMNTPLGKLASTANYNDILKLEADIKRLQDFDQEAFSTYEANQSYQLGSVQPFYQTFIQIVQDFTFTKNTSYDRRSIRQVREQIEDVQAAIYALEKQLRNARQAKALAQQQFENYHSQYQGSAADLPELQAARKAVLDKEGEIAGIQAVMAEKREQIDELNVQILAIKQGVSTDKMTKYQSLQRALSNLSHAVESWKLDHLMKAPADGIVYYYDTRRKQQYVQKSEKVMAIVPFQETDLLVGEMELSTQKAGQVEPG